MDLAWDGSQCKELFVSVRWACANVIVPSFIKPLHVGVLENTSLELVPETLVNAGAEVRMIAKENAGITI